MLGQPVLEALLAQSSELLVVSDAQGRICWANPAWLERCGRADCTGMLLAPCLGPDVGMSAQALQDLLAAALHEGRLDDLVVRLRAPANPAPRSERGHWLRLRIGSVGELRLWTLRDIDAERDAQAQSQRLDELLDTAQEFGRLGVWERDIATGQGRWDQHVFRFWGLDPADGTPEFEQAMARIHPEDRQLRTYAESTRQPGRYAQRYRVLQADGNLRWIHSQWEVKARPDGVPTHAVGVMVDDTEVLSLARSLDDATAQLSLAVELGQIIIWRHELGSNRLYYNPRGFELLGLPYRAEGLSIAEVRALTHPDDLPGVLAAAEQALHRDGPTDVEARYLRSDGHWRHVLTRRVLQRDTQGRPQAFIGVALDLSDRVEQRRQAEELARLLEFATASAGIGVWSHDPQTDEAHWNAQMYQLCGRAPELGPPTRHEWIEQMVHPDDRAAVRAAGARVLASSGLVIEYEFRVLLPGGAVRWLVNRLSQENWHGRPMIFGATLDTTERREAVQVLRHANERIALATRGAGIGTWELDLRHDELRWDDQMYALYGQPPPTDPQQAAKAPALLRRSLAHPDEWPLVLEADRIALAEHRMASYEFRVHWPDGSYRWLASRSVADLDAQGQVLRQIGVCWDVHERVTAEAVRREALAAQRQNEAKSQFLARMSHELRTPLNAILGFTQLLELEAHHGAAPAPASAAPESAQGRRVKLRHIRNASEHLLALVNEVLDLTSLEAGALRLQPEPVPLDAVLEQVLTDVEADARGRAITLRVQGRALTVLADRERLRQVLLKLLRHRMPLLPPGSEIGLVVEQRGTEAGVSLGDNGVSLSSVDQLQLFEAFGAAGRPEEADTGVRLALVKALLAGMGGRIELAGPEEPGNRFIVWLPLALPADSGLAASLTQAQVVAAPHEGEALTAAPVAAPAAPAAAQATVLYIEDNAVNVILVEALIAQRGGLDLVCEPTGSAGVERALSLRPGLVLIDMQLPDIDGFEVLRRLRASPITASTPCIALSANVVPEDMTRAIAAGFDDYWTKPIDFAHFLGGLDRLFARPDPARNQA